jgi:IclR family transcriptional regulator, acetate operon repressor
MRLVKSLLERCFDVLLLLSENAETLPLGEISRRLDFPKSAAHRLLTTLCELGWAEQDPATGFYRLSLRLAIVGQRLLVGTKIPDICQPILDALAAETESLGRLAIVGPDGLTWIAHAQGARSGLIYQPDLIARVPLHVTANGKAWLATLPRSEALIRAVEGGLGRTDIGGPRAIRTRETLSAALDETAERGWALALEEAEPGVSAVSAAVMQNGRAVGTVSVAGPAYRFTEPALTKIAARVGSAAQELSALWPYRLVPSTLAEPEATEKMAKSALNAS